MSDDLITTKPFVSQRQAGWAFATHQPFARRWAKETGPYKKLPKRVKRKAKSYTLDEFTAIALKDNSDPIAVATAAMHTPELSTLKAQQLAPGVSRIKGDLCNVHGRWGSCRAAGYGGAGPKSGRVPVKKLPAAPKPKAGGKRAAARGKKGGRAAPKKTEAQLAQERQAKRAAALQAKQQEQAQNRTATVAKLRNKPNAAALDAMTKLERGEPIDPDMAKALADETGLVDLHKDGSATLSPTGRAFLHALDRGDTAAAEDAQSRAQDRQVRTEERQTAAAERKRAAEERKAAAATKRAEAERLRAERLAKQKKGGGGGKKKPAPKAPTRALAPRSSASPRPVIGGGGARTAPEKKPAPQLAQALTDAAQALSEGQEIDDTTAALLIRNGLAKRNRDGVLILTAAGQRATKKDYSGALPRRPSRPVLTGPGGAIRGDASIAQKSPTPSDYLVVEDPAKLSTYHLQVKRNGKVDHRLMGAAWAALHGGFRGNRYEGPGKQEALTKLKRLYAQESMPLPSEKSFVVFKDASGRYRWIARTTTAYRDRDGEILSEKALEDDAQRMTATGIYGPLRYWHVGQPDPFNVDQPWGPGLDIGACDFSTVIGRTSIESGTFKSEAIGRAFSESASSYELSPGFFHAPTEPDAATGVFNHIRRFERSVVPTQHGRASNLFTGLTVKEHQMDQATYEKRVKAYLDFAREKGIPPEDAAAPIVAMEQADKEATERQIAYKEEGGKGQGVIDFFRAFFTDEQATTKEEEPVVEATAAEVAPAATPDPVASLKEELAALRAEIATLKAPMMAGDEETPMEDTAEGGVEEPGDGGLTLSADDLAAIGQMFGGVLADALQPLVGALGITQKLDGHMTELKGLLGGYVKQKEAGDTQRADQVAALKATIDQQQAAITESQAKLGELLGDQPRNAGYRPSQAADNGAEQLLAAIKDGPDGASPGGPFDDLIANLFPGLAQGGTA